MAETEQPGQVIAPGGASAPSSSPEPEPEIPEADRHKYELSQQNTSQDAQVSSDGEITWTAAEFVAHDKSAGWYGGLILAAILLGALIYLLTRDAISTGVVLIAAFFLGVMAARNPRQLEYKLSAAGLSVGPKHYALEQFRSFSVADEGAVPSIVFMPLKRFAPLTTIYYAPEDEDKIVAILADRLPFEEHKQDPVDRLMHRIRF
jgi:hypothetical protein